MDRKETKEDTLKKEALSTEMKKKAMISALTSSLGIISQAIKKVGISRSTHYKWLAKDIEYKNEVEDIENIAIDFVESKLHELIYEGNVACVIFYLKCKAKSRGYVERSEVEIKHTNPDLSGMSTAELMDLLND